VYKTLGVKWLNQAFCPASAFLSADRNEVRNPQRFIHAAVVHKLKKATTQTAHLVFANTQSNVKKTKELFLAYTH
jgi:hypothetical protein